VIEIFENMTVDNLRLIMDNIKSREESVTGFLGAINSGSMSYIVFCQKSKDDAKTIIKNISGIFNGKGGGRPDFGSGSIKDLKTRNEMLEIIRKSIME
jgi:alanyl-tRNA synthetase